jgi:hypothetical protein
MALVKNNFSLCETMPLFHSLMNIAVKQCCGAGQFLCGPGSSWSKISAPAPAQTFFTVNFQKIQSFSRFQKISNFLKAKLLTKRSFK